MPPSKATAVAGTLGKPELRLDHVEPALKDSITFLFPAYPLILMTICSSSFGSIATPEMLFGEGLIEPEGVMLDQLLPPFVERKILLLMSA